MFGKQLLRRKKNGSLETANLISNNTIVNGVIVRGLDFFKFNIEKAGLITLKVDVAGGVGTLKLFDTDKNVVANSSYQRQWGLRFQRCKPGRVFYFSF